MRARTVWSRAGGAVRLLVALAALAAPPLLLAYVVGNPLPPWPIDWSLVVESVQAGLVPSSVWVKALAVVAWVAWAVLVSMLVVEVVAVVRTRPSGRAVPSWIRQLAQVLVAAAVALAGPGQQSLAAASVGSLFVAASGPVDHAKTKPPAQDQRVEDGRLVTVGEGDSWGGFAADVVGDGALGPRLRDANLGRQVGAGQVVTESTAFVEPGWQLLIPAHLDGRANTAPAGDQAGATWDVADGDHFWGIAERTIEDAWGRSPTASEIFPYWREIVEANSDRLLPPHDPDLIFPGQQFGFPTPPADPHAGPVPSEPEAPPRLADTDVAPAPDIEAPADDGWRSALDPSVAEDVDEGIPRSLDETPRNGLGVPVGLAGGVAAGSLVAAGAVATLRWRRRTALQHRPPGLRLPTPHPDAGVEEARLDAAVPPDAVLDDLATLLASIPPDTHPVLVTAEDNGEITLLFNERDDLPDPPTPWLLAYDGSKGPVGWRAALGDRGTGRSIGLPLLVTLGRSGTSTVLANVTAMGTLALVGEEAQVRRRQRTMSLEVATSRVSVPVEVAVAGDDRLATLDRVRYIDDPDDEIRLSMDEVEQGVVFDDRTPRLLVCHHGIQSPDVPTELRGLVGVLAAAPVAGAWQIDLDDESTGRLHLPSGGTVTLVLPDVDPDVIDDEFTRLVQPASELAASSEPAMVAEPSTNGHKPPPAISLIEPAWCEVQILGSVQVVVNGRKADLTPLLLEVFTYVATHDGVSKERLDAAVWAGQDASMSSQRVKAAIFKIRGMLGDGPDGQPLVPGRGANDLIVLSEHVGCDLHRAFEHLDLAKELTGEARAREIAAALDVVQGAPFQGRPYSWATELSQQAIVNLQDAAVSAARTLREVGDLDAAATVIAKGHKLLDGNGWLYVEQAALEMTRGHPERANLVYEQYMRTLGEDADEVAGIVATPPLEIELAFQEIVAGAGA